MEPYLLRSGQKTQFCPQHRCAPKMAPTSSSQPRGDDAEGEVPLASQEAFTQEDQGEDNSPRLDCKRLAIEMAREIAPDLQETLEHTLQASLGKLQNDVHAHSSRLEELEQRVLILESKNDTLLTKLKSAAGKTDLLEDRLEDLVNRSHHNNLFIVGLTESVKTDNLREICEGELPRALGLNHKCRIEQVHRIVPDLGGEIAGPPPECNDLDRSS